MQSWQLLLLLAVYASGEQSADETPVGKHGQLSVKGNTIIDEVGEPVRLRGMSLFWSQWMGQYWNNETVHWLAKDWRVTVLRASMGVEEGGYLENPEVEKARMEEVVIAAIEAGIYVIIDWHDHNAVDHIPEAEEFFADMAKRYGKYPNVLFELFNEPKEQAWEDIKHYHNSVVEVIRRHSENLIILGTRLWSQEVVEASDDPVTGTNLAYTVHFYAASHGEDLRQKVRNALSNGVAIFATEWGTCEYTGDGQLDLAQTRAWLDFLAEHSISHANWAVSDKAEACSALQGGAAATGGWDPITQLTESGQWVRNSLREDMDSVPERKRSFFGGEHGSQCSAAETEDCSHTHCCQDAGLVCYQKSEKWAACRQYCPEDLGPWSCKILGSRTSSNTSNSSSGSGKSSGWGTQWVPQQDGSEPATTSEQAQWIEDEQQLSGDEPHDGWKHGPGKQNAPVDPLFREQKHQHEADVVEEHLQHQQTTTEYDAVVVEFSQEEPGAKEHGGQAASTGRADRERLMRAKALLRASHLSEEQKQGILDHAAHAKKSGGDPEELVRTEIEAREAENLVDGAHDQHLSIVQDKQGELENPSFLPPVAGDVSIIVRKDASIGPVHGARSFTPVFLHGRGLVLLGALGLAMAATIGAVATWRAGGRRSKVSRPDEANVQVPGFSAESSFANLRGPSTENLLEVGGVVRAVSFPEAICEIGHVEV